MNLAARLIWSIMASCFFAVAKLFRAEVTLSWADAICRSALSSSSEVWPETNSS